MTRAWTDDEKVHVERFGAHYLTVFNDSLERRSLTITSEIPQSAPGRDLVSGSEIPWVNNATRFALDAQDVAVINLSR